MQHQKRSFALIIALLINTAVFASSDLYTVQLDAIDRSAELRKTLFSEAFAAVLVKVSGNEAILQTKHFVRAQQNIDSYIRLYEYQEIESQDTLQFYVQFNKQKIDQLLTKAAVAVWSDNRPVTVLWLNDSPIASKISAKLMKYAKQRGILLVTPLLDAQDWQLISREDIISMQAEKILSATKRYNSNVALVGNINNIAEDWDGSWVFLIGELEYQYNTSGTNLDDLLQDVINNFAKKLSLDYAHHKYVNNSAINAITIIIDNVVQLEDHVKVIQFLKKLPQVDKLEIIKMSPETGLELSLRTVSDFENIKDNISVSNLFTIYSFDSVTQTIAIRLL